jgi:hypothetical protein
MFAMGYYGAGILVRGSRSTAVVLRCRDIPRPWPGAAPPDDVRNLFNGSGSSDPTVYRMHMTTDYP